MVARNDTQARRSAAQCTAHGRRVMKAKPFTITKRELRSALAKLGRSADAVARTLRTRRIKGDYTGIDCPVAMFLRRYFRIRPELVTNETDAKIEKGRIAVSVGCNYVLIDGATV